MWRFVFIGFLLVHGLIHLGVWAAPSAQGRGAPFDPAHSWLLGDRRAVAVTLAVASAALFTAAGVALLAHAGVWRPLTVAGSVVSLVLLAGWFHPWLSLAVVLDAALLAGVVWLDWPPAAVVG